MADFISKKKLNPISLDQKTEKNIFNNFIKTTIKRIFPFPEESYLLNFISYLFLRFKGVNSKFPVYTIPYQSNINTGEKRTDRKKLQNHW